MPAIVDSDDDWETDPDYVNNMSEEQQRWGGARDTGVLDMNKFREEIKQEDQEALVKRQQSEGYKSSSGYGGKFGVLTEEHGFQREPTDMPAAFSGMSSLVEKELTVLK